MCPDKITVNGVEYSRVATNGSRAVMVLDRGWIFAGDLDRSTQGRIRMTRVVHVVSWRTGGFAGMVADPIKAQAKLTPCTDLDVPGDAELFCAPVPDNWGV